MNKFVFRNFAFRRLIFCVAALLLLVAAQAVPRAQAQAAFENAIEINLSDRPTADLSQGPVVFSFTAPTNNQYCFKSFGGTEVSGALYMENSDQVVASGGGFEFSARLIAGTRYYLWVSGAGTADIELMRDALGRSFTQPIELTDLTMGYDKAIARENDVHWYAFTVPEAGLYSVRTQSDLDTVGDLIDESGAVVAHSDDVIEGVKSDFLIAQPLETGKKYYIRVCAKQGQTGSYHLYVDPCAQSGALSLSVEGTLPMREGEQATLKLETDVNMEHGAIFISTDPQVASVDAWGRVTAIKAGTTRLYALLPDGRSDSVEITVQPVPVEVVRFDETEITVPSGESVQLSYAILPEQATNSGISFSSSDEKIATVDENGVLTAHEEGRATIRITAQESGANDWIEVQVTPAPSQYRALVIGEQRYLDGRVRTGSVNTTQGMADLLGQMDFDGIKYQVTMRMDSTRDQMLSDIRTVFADAQARDVSLFYINCHGNVASGTPYLEFYDGSRISARALELELRRIPGTVVVIIDCCYSGGFISAQELSNFSQGVIQVFSAGQAGSFATSKYRVLCSSGSSQLSYRIGYDDADNESSMSTVFSRSLCEAGGWDLIKDRAMSMRADADKDRVVTLNEAYNYVRARVKRYLRVAAAQQDVQVFPAGSPFVLFSRQA